jgi:uncharacterized protein (UPF0147 family)
MQQLNLKLSKKEARKFRASIAEATLQAIAFDPHTPDYLRKIAQNNLALMALLSAKKPPQ